MCFLVTGAEVLSPEGLFVGSFRFYFEWVWVIFGFSLYKREKSRVFRVSRVSFVGFLGISGMKVGQLSEGVLGV